jgi:hypothetical protein
MPVELVTIPNVELLEVGMDWETSTGTFSFTADDLASAVDAVADPSVRTPVLKFGHIDPRFDGQFSVGRVENLHTVNNGLTLAGDYVGVPLWLAEIMASAYPRRSIEGHWDWETYTGNRWPFYLTAVALLGASYPAIATIEDIKAFWGGEPVRWTPGPASDDGAVIKAANGGHMIRATQPQEATVPRFRRTPKASNARPDPAAAVEVDDIRRTYYDLLDETPGQMWWWIRAIQIDPPQLIVDDDDGNLYRVPYTISGDVVSFADPVPVSIVYQDATGGNVAASAGYAAPEGAAVTYPTRDASRGATVAATTPSNPEETRTMTPEQLAAIGLAEGATPDEIDARLAEVATAYAGLEAGVQEPDATPSPEGEGTPAADAVGPVSLPEGVVTIDQTTLDELRVAANAGATARREQLVSARDAAVSAAVREGRIPPARQDHWKGAWDADPAGTRTALASLSPGLIPVAAEKGHGSADTEADVLAGSDAYPAHWFPEAHKEAAR